MDLRKAEYDRAQSLVGLQSQERAGPRREEGAVRGGRRALGEGEDAARLRRHPRALRRHRDREVRPDRPEGHRGRQRAALQDHRRPSRCSPASTCPKSELLQRARGRPGRGRRRTGSPTRRRPGEVQFISPTVDAASGTFQVVDPVRREPGQPAPARASPSRSASRDRADSARVMPMRRTVPLPASLRSTLDRVLVHDVKNMSFRLQPAALEPRRALGDPEFRKPCRSSSPRRSSGWRTSPAASTPHEDTILIKVALESTTCSGQSRQGRDAARAALRACTPASRRSSLALGEVPPEIWGDPYYLEDAFSSLVENALEAAGPGGKVLVRSCAGGTARRPRAVRRDHRQRRRDDARVPARPAASSPSRPRSRTASGSGSRRRARSSGSTAGRSGCSSSRGAAPSCGSRFRRSRERLGVSGPRGGRSGASSSSTTTPFCSSSSTWALKGEFEVVGGARRARHGRALLRVGAGPLPLRPAAAALGPGRGGAGSAAPRASAAIPRRRS